MKRVPKSGYILPKWDNNYAYRATALAYLQKEGVSEVKNVNDKWYSEEEIKQSML